MPAEMIRLQMALAFGALEMQQRMLSGCWQMALWMMPGVAVAGTAPKGGADGGAARRRTASR